MELMIACSAFALLILAAWFYRQAQVDEPEQAYLRLMELIPREGESPESDIMKTGRRAEGVLGEAIMLRFNLLQRLEEEMWQAGMYTRVSEVLIIMLLLFGAGAAGGAAYFADLGMATLGGIALSALPLIYIKLRQRRRLNQFTLKLPHVLDILKSSLEAGHSLIRGMQLIINEFPDPISTEFRMVLEQSRLGMPLQRAMEEMLKRVPEESLRMLVVGVRIQAEVGSSLAEVIGHLAETLRNRQRVRLQLRALTAQSRLSGLVVGLLPVVVLLAFSLIQPNYTHVLFHRPLGIQLIKAAIILDTLAVITVRRLLRVDY